VQVHDVAKVPPPVPNRPGGTPSIETYDHRTRQVVRTGDGPPTGDPIADAAHDNSRIVLDFMRVVLGRNSVDGAGMAVQNIVHHPEADNAAWRRGAVRFGDGVPGSMAPFATALDLVAHEMFHGVTEYTAGLGFTGQAGSIDESFSDVFAEAAEQWHEDRAGFGTPEGAGRGDWAFGEDLMLDPKMPMIRDLRNPANPATEQAAQGIPQVEHMGELAKASPGSVYINSGIPNKAAYEAAMKIGTEKVTLVWYEALERLGRHSRFEDAAQATVEAARALYPDEPGVAGAVQDAWAGRGLLTT
jgi:Zn-dependent metalloprotease